MNYNNPELGLLQKILDKLEIYNEFFCRLLWNASTRRRQSKPKSLVLASLKFIDEGYTILSIVPSCTLMLSLNGHYFYQKILCKKLGQNTKTRVLVENLLMKINIFKALKKKIIFLHISCHSDQNIGQKATELLDHPN